jgi:hypothetical protein
MLLSPSILPIHHGGVGVGVGSGSSPRDPSLGGTSFGGHHLSPPRGRPPLTTTATMTHQPQKPHHLSWITSTLVPPLPLQGELRITTPPSPFRQPESSASDSEEAPTSTGEGGDASLSSTSGARGPGVRGGPAAGEHAFLRPSPVRGSPVSPTAGGRSILSMLLERERNHSIASDATIIAREATAAERSSTQQHVAGVIGEVRGQGSEENAGFWSTSGSTSLSTTPPSDKTATPRAVNAQAASAQAQEENQLVFPTSSPVTTTPPSESPDDLRGHHGFVKKSSRRRRRVPDEEEGRAESADVDVTTPLLLGHDRQKQQKLASYGGTESPTDTASTSSPPAHILYATSAALERHAGLSSPHYSPTASPSKEIVKLLHTATQYASPKAFGEGVVTTLQTLPSVMLGLLLNILDGVSYGFIIFPAGPVFAGFGSMGVSMFFVTCVCQHDKKSSS